MALTADEEEYLRRKESGVVEETPLNEDQLAYLTRKETGQAPPDATPPTTGESAQHIAARWGSGLLDVADLPYYLREGKEALAPYVPEGVKTALSYTPPALLAQAMEEYYPEAITDYTLGKKQATEEIPGLIQARDLTEQYTLPEERLEEAPITEYAGVGAEWLGLPGASAGANVVKRGAKGIPDAVNLFKKEARDAAIIAGSATAGSAAGDWAGGGEGQTIGELIGGVTGLVAALKTGKIDGLTAAQRRMLAELQSRFENSDEAMAAIQKALSEGEIGTLMDLTGSRVMADIEAAARGTPAGATEIPKTLDQRVDQIYTDTRKALQGEVDPTISPEVSSQTAAKEVNRVVKDIETGKRQELDVIDKELKRDTRLLKGESAQAWDTVDQRTQAADEATEAFDTARKEADPGKTTVEASEGVTSRLDRAKKAYETRVEDPAWDAVDAGPPLDVRALRKTLKPYLDNLDPDDANELIEIYGKYIRRIGTWGDTVEPATVTRLISRMKAAVHDADKFGYEERLLDDFVNALEDTLATPDSLYETARAATNEKYNRFGGRVGDAAKGDMPETTVSELGTQGDIGAATVRQVEAAQVPTASRDLYDYILAEATRRGEDLTPAFLREYQGAVNRMPEADRLKLERLVETKQTRDTALDQARRAEDEAARLAKMRPAKEDRLVQAAEAAQEAAEDKAKSLVKSTRGSTLGEYAKGNEQADAVVDDILSRRDGAEKLEDLRAALLQQDEAQGGQFANMDSFHNRIVDRLGKRLFRLFEPGKSEAPLPEALRDFREMRSRLVRNEMISDADAQRIDDLLARMETETLRKDGVARVGDITTAADEATGLMSSILASAALGWLPGAYNLQMGGAARRYFKVGLEARPTKQNIEALVQYITDPEAFLKGIEKLDSDAAKAQFVLAKLVGTAQAAEIMAGEDDAER